MRGRTSAGAGQWSIELPLSEFNSSYYYSNRDNFVSHNYSRIGYSFCIKFLSSISQVLVLRTHLHLLQVSTPFESASDCEVTTIILFSLSGCPTCTCPVCPPTAPPCTCGTETPTSPDPQIQGNFGFNIGSLELPDILPKHSHNYPV